MNSPNLPSDYQQYSPLSDDDGFNLKRYISLFISNWYWFAIAMFVTLTIAYGINRYSEKIYDVSSTLLIKDDQIGGSSTGFESVIPGGDIFKSQQNLTNEMGILKSFRINYQVMKELNDFHVVYTGVGRRGIVESRLYKTCPFFVYFDSLEIQPIGIKVGIEILSKQKYRIELNGNIDFKREINFGEQFSEFGFDFNIKLWDSEKFVFNERNSNNYFFYISDPENLANQYRGKLTVEPIEEDASIVNLSVSGFSPAQEADYLNKLMEVYIRYGLDNKNQTADSTIKFIDDQIGIISDSLEIAAGILERFRSNNNFINLSNEGALIQNRLERYEIEKATNELHLQYYNYLSEYLDKKITTSEIISPSVMGITDEILIKLVNELASMEKEWERLVFNIEQDQPALGLIEKQTNRTRDALKENIRNGIENIRISIAESDKKIKSIEAEIGRLPSTERNLLSIQRKFDLNNTVYTYLLEKRAESGIARASNVSDNRIIDKASQNRAVMIKPRARYNYIIALMLGLLMPIALIILIDYLNDKVIDKRDLERRTNLPVIGYIGHSDGRNEIPVTEKPGSSLSESFRSVRTAIKYYTNENEVPVIAVSSTISSEGKTFISINLAAVTAMLGKKVLLVGLDLRKPRINKVFEFENSLGMSTFLSGNCTYSEIIKQTQVSNLFYAPSGPIPPNPAELIETDRMKTFIETAKKEFDFIIIDTPPVALVTDTLLLAQYVDVNLFIVRQRYTSRNTINLIEELHQKGNLKNMAIIINDISLSGYYGYGVRYGYSMGYGYSYGYNYYGSGYYGRYGDKKSASGYYTEE